jgi:hypothetical protein
MARRNLGAHSAHRLAGGHLALAVAEALRHTPTSARARVNPLRRRSQSARESHPARAAGAPLQRTTAHTRFGAIHWLAHVCNYWSNVTGIPISRPVQGLFPKSRLFPQRANLCSALICIVSLWPTSRKPWPPQTIAVGRLPQHSNRSRSPPWTLAACGVAGLSGRVRQVDRSEILLHGAPATILDRGASLDDEGDRGGPTIGRLLEVVSHERARCLRGAPNEREALSWTSLTGGCTGSTPVRDRQDRGY